MWLWIHLITWIILLLVLAMALFTDAKHRTPFVMIARVGYVVMIVSGYLLTTVAFNRNPALTVLKLLLAFGFIGLAEISFAHAGKLTVSPKWRWLVLGCCVLVGLVGFLLAQGRPFMHY